MRSRSAYYNEFDPKAAAWLRHLIEEGEIAHGVVDERSIRDVEPADLRGYAQCHFFAGIGIWSHALRRAGWADDEPIWTGSCPCQPFSAAGKGLGFDDPRHLWPDFLRLISECRPQRVFGEQVASAGQWIDLVSTDLEACGYAFAAPDLPAAGFSFGEHIRQRFYWVADADNSEWWSERAPWNECDWPETGRVEGYRHPGERGSLIGLGNAHRSQPSALAGDVGEVLGVSEAQWSDECSSLPGGGGETGGLAVSDGWDACAKRQLGGGEQRQQPEDGGASVRLGDANDPRLSLGSRHPDERGAIRIEGTAFGEASPLRGRDWLLCSDGKLRAVETGTFPLAATSPGRVGLLRGYGNGLDAEVAANFIAAYRECAPVKLRVLH